MKKYVDASDQDNLIEIFPHIYLLRESIKLGPLLQMNRNMVIVREGHDLIIINAVRLNQQNLEKLNQLGTVKHVIRLGDFHGLDDQFYIDTYQAEFWSQKQHQTYPELIPNKIIDEKSIPPIKNSLFFIFKSAKYPEAVLLLNEHKLLVSTDSIQYWNDWKHSSVLSRIILWLMGFRLGLFIGGPWLKKVSPQKGGLKKDFESLLKLDFTNLISAHGNVLKNTAKDDLRKIIDMTFR